MRVRAKVVGQVNIPKDKRVVLDHVHVRGEDYSCRKLMQFCTIGARLEECRFDKTRINCAQFGAGRDMSEFVACNFDGAHIEMGSGGYSRFVGCSFRDVDLRSWKCFAVEMIDCTFSGRLRVGIFNGTVRKDDRMIVGRDRNEFHGNDFSGMELIDVGFRTGIDLSQQRLPTGPEYLYLPDAATAVSRALTGLADWTQDVELHRVATSFVKGLEEEVVKGQRQMLLRAEDYYPYLALPREAVDKVFALLGGESA
jgi:hypothetical protein